MLVSSRVLKGGSVLDCRVGGFRFKPFFGLSASHSLFFSAMPISANRSTDVTIFITGSWSLILLVWTSMTRNILGPFDGFPYMLSWQ